MTTTADRPQPVLTHPPPPSAPPVTWAALRPLVLRIHFYAGVFVAPFLVVACLTGLAYVFSPQLSDAIYADELLVGAHSGPVLPLDTQIAAALATQPEGTLSSVVVQSDPDRTTAVVLAVPGLAADVERTVYVDPYTGQVRGALDTWFDAPPVQTLLDGLHRNLLLGEPGRLYSELAASWLPVLVLGGLALWIGKRRSRRKVAATLLAPLGMRPGRARMMGWHGSMGIWLALALLFISATGLTWSHYAGERFSAAVVAVHGSSLQLAAEPVPVRDVGRVAVQTAVDAGRDAGLADLLKVTVPAEPGAPFTVSEDADTWPVQRDAVAVDPYTGQITETVRWRDYPLMAKLTRIGILAHMGSLFGLVSQLALTAMAVGLLCVLFWGYRMWWQRRPTRQGRMSRTAPAPRGVLRGLSQPVVFVIVLITVAVGWAIPLLGISLLIFLATDVAVGAATIRMRSA